MRRECRRVRKLANQSVHQPQGNSVIDIVSFKNTKDETLKAGTETLVIEFLGKKKGRLQVGLDIRIPSSNTATSKDTYNFRSVGKSIFVDTFAPKKALFFHLRIDM